MADATTHVGHLFECYGQSGQGYDIFLAQRLRMEERALDPEEQGLIARPFVLGEVVAMTTAGVIKDGTTIAAFGLAQTKGLIRL